MSKPEPSKTAQRLNVYIRGPNGEPHNLVFPLGHTAAARDNGRLVISNTQGTAGLFLPGAWLGYVLCSDTDLEEAENWAKRLKAKRGAQ